MAEPGRRTVVIRGQVVDRYSPRRSIEAGPPTRRSSPERHGARRPAAESAYPRRSSSRSRSYESRHPTADSRSSRRRGRPYDPPRARPDRIALWAVLLGIVLLLAAATSSHAAVLAHLAH